VGRQDAEPVPVFLERLREGIDMFPEGDTLLSSGSNGSVIYVGEIHDVEDSVPAGLQPPSQQILEQEGPEIADVRVVVDGRSAGVERHPAGL
jgi:hypothetical protein